MRPTQTDWQICLVTPLKKKKTSTKQPRPLCVVEVRTVALYIFAIFFPSAFCESNLFVTPPPPECEMFKMKTPHSVLVTPKLRRRVSPPERNVGTKAGSRCGLGCRTFWGSWRSRLVQLISVFFTSVVLINCVSFVRRGLVLRDTDNKLIQPLSMLLSGQTDVMSVLPRNYRGWLMPLFSVRKFGKIVSV